MKERKDTAESTAGHKVVKKMEKYYIVKSIDGDYANLVDENDLGGETKLVARALLPESIAEGTRLHYAFLQYEIAVNFLFTKPDTYVILHKVN